MPRNLREKLHAILQDGYDLKPETVVIKLERLIQEELQLTLEERHITAQDLMHVKADAARELVSMRLDAEALGPLYGDDSMIRTLCLVYATTALLKRKGLMTAIVKFKK